MRSQDSCWLAVAVVTMVTGYISNAAVNEDRTVKQCY